MISGQTERETDKKTGCHIDRGRMDRQTCRQIVIQTDGEIGRTDRRIDKAGRTRQAVRADTSPCNIVCLPNKCFL